MTNVLIINMKNKVALFGFLFLIVFISGCIEKPITEDETPEQTVTPTPTEKVKTQKEIEYIVTVKENSNFEEEATRFSQAKNAELTTYSNNFDEVLEQLKAKKPKFLAIFATPEELTPDFLDDIDLKLREIDNDPYLDVAYGIITSRNKELLEQYVTKLLSYSPPDSINVYGIGNLHTDLKYNYNIDADGGCLFNCASSFCICTKEEQATIDKINNNIKKTNFLLIDAHGSPDTIALDEGEKLQGSVDKLLGIKSDSTQISLKTDATLVLAASCLTGQINGKPSKIYPEFGEVEGIGGGIDTSIVLSAIQSGTLSYIGATHVALSGFTPNREIKEESILKNEPIGIALKDFKNRLIMNTEKFKVDIPGSPMNNDIFTKDLILFETRNWILFGDPSIKLSSKTYSFDPDWTTSKYNPDFSSLSCLIQSSETETKTKDGLIKKSVTIKFNPVFFNFGYSYSLSQDNTGKWSAVGGQTCVFKTPIKGSFVDVKIVSIEKGIKKEYTSGPYPASAFFQNLGDEVFVMIPRWVQEISPDSNSIVVQYPEIATQYGSDVKDDSDIVLTYEVVSKE